MIYEIKLNKFGRFINKEISLSPGLNIITGSNFSGKSTICDAIYFTLFGTSLKNSKNIKRCINYNELISEVLIKLKNGTKTTELIRDTSSKYLKINGSFIKLSQEDKLFEEAIGNNKNIISYSFLKDSEVIEFLSMTSGDKKQLMYGLSGLNILEEIRDAFIENRKQSKTELKNIQTNYDIYKSKLNFEAEQNFNNIKLKKDELIEKYNKYVSNSNSENSPGNRAIKNVLDDYENELKNKNQQLDMELTGYNSITGLENKIYDLERETEDYLTKQLELEELNRRISKGEAYISELESQVMQLNIISSGTDKKCPICTQDIENIDLENIISRKANKLSSARMLLDDLTQKFDLLKKDADILNRKMSEKQQLTFKLGYVKNIQEDISRLKEKINLNSSGVNSLSNSYYESIYLKSELDKININYEEALSLKVLHESNYRQFLEEEKKLNKVKKNKDICEMAVQGVESTIATILNNTLNSLDVIIKKYLDIFNILNDFKVSFSTNDYMPKVSFKEKPVDIKSLSGSEKSLIYIAMKLAIGAALGNDILILDDPLVYLDNERQINFLKCVSKLSKSGIQIIMTTSNPEYGVYGDRVINL
ncbi:MAG: AAA family ATPase [Bacillota bacterium]|nr:AAA family ATPase [Bacillota bacterium]